MEEVQRVSAENLRLMERQHLFLLDASHELGIPITVALGHAEHHAAVGARADLPCKAQVEVAELVDGHEVASAAVRSIRAISTSLRFCSLASFCIRRNASASSR